MKKYIAASIGLALTASACSPVSSQSSLKSIHETSQAAPAEVVEAMYGSAIGSIYLRSLPLAKKAYLASLKSPFSSNPPKSPGNVITTVGNGTWNNPQPWNAGNPRDNPELVTTPVNNQGPIINSGFPGGGNPRENPELVTTRPDPVNNLPIGNNNSGNTNSPGNDPCSSSEVIAQDMLSNYGTIDIEGIVAGQMAETEAMIGTALGIKGERPDIFPSEAEAYRKILSVVASLVYSAIYVPIPAKLQCRAEGNQSGGFDSGHDDDYLNALPKEDNPRAEAQAEEIEKMPVEEAKKIVDDGKALEESKSEAGTAVVQEAVTEKLEKVAERSLNDYKTHVEQTAAVMKAEDSVDWTQKKWVPQFGLDDGANANRVFRVLNASLMDYHDQKLAEGKAAGKDCTDWIWFVTCK